MDTYTNTKSFDTHTNTKSFDTHTNTKSFDTHTNSKPFSTVLFSLIILSMSALLLTGCLNNQPKPAPAPLKTCMMPQTNKLEQAIEMTKRDLTFEQCAYNFTNYFENLLTIAAGDPNIAHKKRFSDFLMWCNSEGLLTKVQAKSYYNQYFNTVFAALPSDYNICSICTDKETLIQKMEQELTMKEKGLLKACADKTTYFKANEQLNTLIFLLDSTCRACE